MDTGEQKDEFSQARRLLLKSGSFNLLRSRGHALRHGAVLTSVSDVPLEMSVKCIDCGVTFWLENVAWSTGGIGPWRLSCISQETASLVCPGASKATGANAVVDQIKGFRRGPDTQSVVPNRRREVG
jgi:hypothetical protein